jgi:hypothetical protein
VILNLGKFENRLPGPTILPDNLAIAPVPDRVYPRPEGSFLARDHCCRAQKLSKPSFRRCTMFGSRSSWSQER